MVSIAMLALSSLSQQQPLRRHPVRRPDLLQPALYGVLRFITAQHPASRGCRSATTSRRSATSSSGVPPRFQTPWLVSLLLVAVLIAVSVLVLERRVRGVEVVA